jgi:hypothetical protein
MCSNADPGVGEPKPAALETANEKSKSMPVRKKEKAHHLA